MKRLIGRICVLISIISVLISFYYIPNETLPMITWERIVFGGMMLGFLTLTIGVIFLMSHKEDMRNKERRRKIREEYHRQMREIYAAENQ